jgi:hypothetical protein
MDLMHSVRYLSGCVDGQKEKNHNSSNPAHPNSIYLLCTFDASGGQEPF